MAAHLKHHAIVKVFDVTQTSTKLQIEMEFLEGLTCASTWSGAAPSPVGQPGHPLRHP